ncbi:MAG: alpha/beta fold hydrolase [Candidatus Omnitrophica bacterium]|nr:alpha/beta fold hydrolase [Candidatus Omnitrophota bacterium]
MNNYLENKRSLLIFLCGALIVTAGFSFILSSGSEVFFMSVPIWAVLGIIIFRVKLTAISKKDMIVGIVNIVVLFFVTIVMFHHFAKMMFGQVIWREVILAAYFLLAVGILITGGKKMVALVASLLTSKVKNEFLVKSVRWFCLGLFWIFIILPFFLETFALHRLKIGDRINPHSELMLSYENVNFRTKDHLLLNGWFVPAHSDKTVIIGHGAGANKSNFLGVVDFWHSLNFNVLIFDFRGHGQSQGHTISLGYRERWDIEAGLDYLINRADVNSRKIIGYGVSFGGGAMIHAAAEDARLQTIIIDSAYANMNSMALQTVEKVGFIPPVFVRTIAAIGLSMASLESGFDIRRYSPQWAMAQVKQPVLLLHGKNDTMIPWQESEKLFAAANEPKAIHLFETQGHYTTMDDSSYRPVVEKFLGTVFKESGN